MLRVRTIYAAAAESAANYYTRYLTEAPGEVPGVWTGDQADALGLTGHVDGDDLRALLEGRDPVSGTPLGRPFEDRYRADGTVVHAVAGFDATFSAPKSLSVLWALTQDDRLLEAHDTAVRAALRHLERYGSTTRVRADGRRLHPDSQGLTMATFRQTTSRSDDPQLHTHVVISSKVRTDDGRWLALDARYAKGHQRMLGGVYQSVLRNELTHRFGVAWETIDKGQAEMLGVPVELRELFSKRSEEIERAIAVKVADFAQREGRDPNEWELGAIKREAAVDTRRAKTGNGVSDLTARWESEARSIGWNGRDLVLAVTQAGRDHPPEPDRVSLDTIVAALSTRVSAWNRAHVVQALCDVARPNHAMNGERWAELIERLADDVVSRCVELDPDEASAPRRRSDGRSMWLEPTSTHITTDAILREEEFVLTWALDAQVVDSSPSTTVDTNGLDVLQADAAAAVAGEDRLVLVVGPAGAGKTTTLRSAFEDLHAEFRDVFGVAPSAKAARVLERETGVPSDTLAKLLHEWSRPDHRVERRYALPVGTTVLVDEASMVGTPALARLVSLADRQQWRLVLVGDPHQLQAVGRGGLFRELCEHGRTHDLARIHRFVEPWEAAASLLVRQGDQRGLDAYLEHGRIVAGTFDDHLDAIVDRWLVTAARHGTAAIATSTNDHVTAINAAVQRVRIDVGQVDDEYGAPIGGGEVAYVGDQVATRRNDRRIETSHGEPIRNRELWTVTDVGADGSIAVSSMTGHGTAVLPSDYVCEHVRLGYAATEHGVQGDTVTIGAEIATTATTRRGLYVGLTRGREENRVYVVTESRDLDEARDVLEGILAIDRADMPATAQRRELAQADRRPTAAPKPSPRCEVPEWFSDLRGEIQADLADAERRVEAAALERERLEEELAEAKHQQLLAERRLDPHRPTIDAAQAEVKRAQQLVWSINNSDDMRSRGRRHRRAVRESRAAHHDLDEARSREAAVEARIQPERAAINDAVNKVRNIRRSIESTELLARLDRWDDTERDLRELLEAVDDWRSWATGKPVMRERVEAMVTTLTAHDGTRAPECRALAEAVHHWAQRSGIELSSATPEVPRVPTPELGIEL